MGQKYLFNKKKTMKRILLALLVSLGLQLQAQSSCDSTMSYTVGSQYQLEVVFGIGGNTPSTWSAPIYVVTYGNGNILAEDSCFGQPCPHIIYNYNMLTGMPYDTLTTCVSYVTSDSLQNIDTLWCCFDQYWDGQAWARMMQQQPYFCCDSITYWTDQSQGFNIGLDTTNMIHNPDSIEVNWGICNSVACYPGTGMYAYFPQIMTTDTVKACYDVYLYENGTLEVCSQCDSLIFDQGSSSWIMFSSQGNTTGIEELMKNESMNNITYDMLGREVINPIHGVMYIRNNKKFIIIR